jgi:hypothetical protein
MRRVTAIAAAFFFCAASASAQPAEYHWRIKSYIEGAAKLCKEHGGTPGTPDFDKLVRLIDVNNDGKDDYVIDYRHFPCAGGAPNIFCVEDSCSISFLSWRSDNEWMAFMHTGAVEWRVRKGDKPALLLLQHGDRECYRPHLPRCTKVYTFRKGAMSGQLRDAKYFKTAK